MNVSFQNVTNNSGVSYTELSWGAAWTDFSGDGYPDLGVSNHQAPGIFYLREDSLEIKGNNFGGSLMSGTLPKNQFVSGTTAIASGDRFIYDQSTGNLFSDVDGNDSQRQVLIGIFSKRANLTANDIVIL